MKRIFNKFIIIAIIFAFLEQILVSSSIFVIQIICDNFINNRNFMIWIFLYMIIMTTVYIPTMLMNYFFNKGSFEAYIHLINSFSKKSFGKIEAAFDRNFSKKTKPFFTHESFMIIDEDVKFIQDFFQLFFNVVLSVIVIGKIIDKSFILAYLISLPISYITVKFFNNKIEIKSDRYQDKKNSLMLIMNSGWTSILIGNLYNYKLWKNTFKSKCEEASRSKCNLDITLDFSAFILVIVSAIPVFISIVHSFSFSSQDLVKKAVIVATLPRQLGIIQYLSDLINILISYKDKNRRTENLFEKFEIDNKCSRGKVIFEKIKLIKNNNFYDIKNFEDIENITKSYSPGRFSIVGDNGSGKSTLLTLIKEKNMNKSYFVSSNTEMTFNFDNKLLQASDGQKLIHIFREINNLIDKDKSIKILLLDEINANLDNNNNKIINNSIEKISKKICVIEVIHYQI